MKKGGIGGANTLTGLRFEKKVDLYILLSKISGYSIKKPSDRSGVDVYFENELVARCFRKMNSITF